MTESPSAASPAPPPELARPDVRLHGEVGDPMLQSFLDGLAAAETAEGPLVVELTTTGGDADVGLRIAADLRLFRERTGRRALVFGKAAVYSAGVSILAGAPPQDRWLARGTMLLIHGRQLSTKLDLNGPLVRERERLAALMAEIEAGLALERQGFEALIAGSTVQLEDLLARARTNWYVPAEEALARGLIAGLV
jgi:ATP-dependent protease ClpP protease subunit